MLFMLSYSPLTIGVSPLQTRRTECDQPSFCFLQISHSYVGLPYSSFIWPSKYFLISFPLFSNLIVPSFSSKLTFYLSAWWRFRIFLPKLYMHILLPHFFFWLPSYNTLPSAPRNLLLLHRTGDLLSRLTMENTRALFSPHSSHPLLLGANFCSSTVGEIVFIYNCLTSVNYHLSYQSYQQSHVNFYSFFDWSPSSLRYILYRENCFSKLGSF